MAKRFQISANGTEMGVYEGDTERDAINAYVKDAGYGDVEIAAEACGQSVEEFLDDIAITEATN